MLVRIQGEYPQMTYSNSAWDMDPQNPSKSARLVPGRVRLVKAK